MKFCRCACVIFLNVTFLCSHFSIVSSIIWFAHGLSRISSILGASACLLTPWLCTARCPSCPRRRAGSRHLLPPPSPGLLGGRSRNRPSHCLPHFPPCRQRHPVLLYESRRSLCLLALLHLLLSPPLRLFQPRLFLRPRLFRRGRLRRLLSLTLRPLGPMLLRPALLGPALRPALRPRRPPSWAGAYALERVPQWALGRAFGEAASARGGGPPPAWPSRRGSGVCVRIKKLKNISEKRRRKV